jgi:protein TonB
VEDGVPGGVEGGVPGGIAGGVVGGLPEPPPQPPPEDRAPVRVGGSIQEPTLLRRVEPAYPPIAVSARLQGLVILEALVERDGAIADIKVLRSAGPVLDREALIAVRQWRYSPLVLNGQRKSFVVTVTLSFSVEIERSNPSYAVRAK